MQVRIVGAGWAGLAAAVAACERGWHVHLIEASHHAGGRARRLAQPVGGTSLDNGQHILIGAYSATLGLMRQVGVPDDALWRMRLDTRDAQGRGLCLPDLPPPWHLLLGLVRARGWSWRDKVCLLHVALTWQHQGFTCTPTWTVADLCEAHAITPRLREDWIEPLCLSALNTAVHEASAAVFLRVLHDALLGGAGSTDFLLPRVDLSALMPDAALAWLAARGATIQLGERVQAHDLHEALASKSDDQAWVLATPSVEAARLTAEVAPEWSAQTMALPQRAIATVYLQTDAATMRQRSRPILALRNGPAQFVFCRGHTHGEFGLLAAVVSDCQMPRDTLAEAVCAQVQAQLGLSNLAVVQTVVEKRATFACTPGLVRPSAHVQGSLWACGDYIEGPYPATLEGAVRSGQQVIAQLAQMRETRRR